MKSNDIEADALCNQADKLYAYADSLLNLSHDATITPAYASSLQIRAKQLQERADTLYNQADAFLTEPLNCRLSLLSDSGEMPLS